MQITKDVRVEAYFTLTRSRRLGTSMTIAYAVLALLIAQANPVVASQTVTDAQRVLASDAEDVQYFGNAVAIEGDIAFIGAEFNDEFGTFAGAVYRYERVGGVWVEQEKLGPALPFAGGQFGGSLALSGDRLVVGASKAGGSGRAYVFSLVGAVWVEEAVLAPVDTLTNGALFGSTVSMDGETILVGAISKSIDSVGSGATYVFALDEGAWAQQDRLAPSDATGGDLFGSSVALLGDRALVGARAHDGAGSSQGAAYVFDRSGVAWSFAHKISPPIGVDFGNFGVSVALSQDEAFVGGRADTAGVHLFSASNGWAYDSTLLHPLATSALGSALALNDDQLAVGDEANDEAAFRGGAVFVFERVAGAWTSSVDFLPSSLQSSDSMGDAVALSGDDLLAGAFNADDAGTRSGAAYFGALPAQASLPATGLLARICLIGLLCVGGPLVSKWRRSA